MIKYHLDKEAYEYLNNWAENHLEAAKYCPAFDKKSVVTLSGFPEITFYSEEKRYGTKFSIKIKEKGQVCKGQLLHLPDSDSDFDIKFQFSDSVELENYESLTQMMKVYTTAYVHANCFMWFGNIAEERAYKAEGKNNGNSKIITFRKYKDSIYAVPVGHHKSPEGVFTVRGHFRRLQNGKVIWIDSFIKGR